MDEKKEREELKKKYLGLERPEQVGRLQKNYKSQLLFEWNKSDDTSAGVLNKFSSENLKMYEKRVQVKAE